MANYILGLGGHCCDTCAPDNPCKDKPFTTTDIRGALGPYATSASISANIATTDWPWYSSNSFAATGLPAGVSISSSGTVSGTAPSTPGYYIFYVTASNACGNGSVGYWIIVTGGGCASCNEIIFSESAIHIDGGVTDSYSYDVSGKFTCAKPFHFEWQFNKGEDDGCGRAILYSNGTPLHDTGCICDTSGSIELTMPAGTVTVSVDVIGCDAYGCTYSVGGNCYDP